MQILLAVPCAAGEGAATVTVHVTRMHLRARSVDARGARMHKQRCGGCVCDARVRDARVCGGRVCDARVYRELV